MKAPTTKEERKLRDADFERRMQPRLLWPSQTHGPAIRVEDKNGNVSYRAKPIIRKKSKARKLTEAEDNAIGRATRRRQNRALRGWLPYAAR